MPKKIIPNFMSDKNTDAYNDGYNQGKDAGMMDDFVHSNFKSSDSSIDKSYNAGWEDGMSDKYDSDNSHYSGDSGSSDGGGVCFVTSACVKSKGLSDDCAELEILRKFRNEYVLNLDGGAELNKEYKRIAPQIVKKINESSNSTQMYDDIYSDITNMVYLINKKENEQALLAYESMVTGLAEKLNVD